MCGRLVTDKLVQSDPTPGICIRNLEREGAVLIWRSNKDVIGTTNLSSLDKTDHEETN